MRRAFPRVGRVRDMRSKWTRREKSGALVSVNNRPRCVACGAEADCKVDVEVNWFRGDDEVLNSCKACSDKPAALLEGAAR